MTIVIFIIILALLILVHELGHFLIAKRAGMRVDEFGLGLPPRAKTLWKKGETEYTLNWIPFGGFVRIFGENLETVEAGTEHANRSFASKPHRWQIAVLAAGVAFNILFAWLLFSIGFMIGMPVAQEYDADPRIQNPQVMITGVLPGSPAHEATLAPGDLIRGVEAEGQRIEAGEINVVDVQELIKGSDVVTLHLDAVDGSAKTLVIPTKAGLIEEGQAIGISLATVGVLQLPWYEAIGRGLMTTVNDIVAIVDGFVYLIKSAVTGSGSALSALTGPVGIAGLVGDAAAIGFVYLLSFTALLSLHLAVLNFIPFPALDGGRILFVIIEKIKGSPLNPKMFQWVNGVGFALLILLMIVVTFNDIIRLF